MAFQTNFSVIEYLQRRVIYYKKLKGSMKNYFKTPDVIKKYGKRKIAKALEGIEERIQEYETAIKYLQSKI